MTLVLARGLTDDLVDFLECPLIVLGHQVTECDVKVGLVNVQGAEAHVREVGLA